ncbi:hypothetical protein GCM10023321_21070 [Pseudonocardia eucalypti]|uniref:Small ribosomal subunit protein bS20 n=1 Tax=Pseudonocardia eucalypti TaxID=648755 RepID=A0ABP9PZI9_9PSEU
MRSLWLVWLALLVWLASDPLMHSIVLSAAPPGIRGNTQIRPGDPEALAHCYPGKPIALRDPLSRRALVKHPRPRGARRTTTNRRTRGSRVANIKSQIKRVKTNEKRRLRNKSVRSAVRTAIRRFREAVEAGDNEQIVERQRFASRALDKAASKGVIHRNQAANKKAAMAQRVNSL